MALCNEISVLGSFPGFTENPDELAKYWLGVQQAAGVDYPCLQNLFGGDMTSMFLDDPGVHGFELNKEKGRYELIDMPKVRATVQHGYLRSLQQIARGIGYTPRGWAIPVTGPFTLAQSIYLPGRDVPLVNDRENREDFIRQLAEGLLVPIVEHYDRTFSRGIIRLDEPVADSGNLTGDGAGQYGIDNGYVREILDGILAKIKNNAAGVHVCGDIGSAAVMLSTLSHAGLLSHDFSGARRHQLDYYRERDLERNGTVLGLGVVSTASAGVESYEEAKAVYDEACRKFGRERVHLHPSCGFGPFMKSFGLPLEEATERIYRKLSVLDRLRKG